MHGEAYYLQRRQELEVYACHVPHACLNLLRRMNVRAVTGDNSFISLESYQRMILQDTADAAAACAP